MNMFYHVAGSIYIFLGIAVVLFGGYVLFMVLVLPALEYIPAGWTVTAQDYIYSIVAEIVEHLSEVEHSRHRKIDFTQWVLEAREINEGRRMPVSISG